MQNYIDDTGVQVADVVVGFRELEHKTPRARSATIADTTRFDYYCWDLYARVTEWYERDKAAARDRARETLHDLEHGGNETAAIGAFIVDRIVRCHLKTMARLNIGLRPADVRGRHPAAAVLGACVRDPQGARAPCSCRPKASWPAAG